MQKLEGSTQKSLDEDISKHNDDNQPQLPDSQSHKIDDESDRLKVTETLKESPRRASNENNHYTASSNEKDVVDECIPLSSDATDSKTDSSRIVNEKSSENGLYNFEKFNWIYALIL